MEFQSPEFSLCNLGELPQRLVRIFWGELGLKKKLKCKTVSGQTKLILHELFPDLLYEIAPVIIKMRAL